MPEARRFLLVRLDGLGDALACVPALEGLRRAHPGAAFGALCSRANAELFSPLRVERVHRYDETTPDAQLVAELRAARYTDALVATEEPAGYVLARGSGARRRAGFWHRLEKPFKSLWQFTQLTDAVYRPAAWVDEPEHEIAAIYRLAQRLGAGSPIPAEASELRAWLDVFGASSAATGADTLAFQIASKLTQGGWEPSVIAGLVTAALERASFDRCVLLAAPDDEGLARSVLEQIPRGYVESGRVVLAPPAQMSRWLASIASAGALVTPDTGAAHAAGILGVPVVDLFEPERFEQLSLQWRPWAAPSRCLIKPSYRQGAQVEFGERIANALAEVAPQRDRKA